LGFTPEWTLEGGVMQVLTALRSGRVQDYRDPKYSNVLYLTGMSDSVYLTTETDYARGLISEAETHELLSTGGGGNGEVRGLGRGPDRPGGAR
jgi:hypothetical protein